MEQKLNLHSLQELEQAVGLPARELLRLAAARSQFYSPFTLKAKRRPFQKKMTTANRARSIDNPTGQLKHVQGVVNRHLLRQLTLAAHIYGGVRGRSIVENARVHQDQKIVVKVDIRSFFRSIRASHVRAVWNDLLGCSSEVSRLLTDLTTHQGHLPLGAPTSTPLANLVLYSIDGAIRRACNNQNIRYSTWVDDLSFSGEAACDIIELAVRTLRTNGFFISRRKLQIMRPGQRKIITGVVLGKRAGVPRERLQQLRSGIHKLRIGAVARTELAAYVKSLEGKIAHVSSIAPRKAAKLRSALRVAAGGGFPTSGCKLPVTQPDIAELECRP